MKFISLLSLIYCQFAYCQNYNIQYEYKFVPDSNYVDNKLRHTLILNISPDHSEYFSSEKFQFDSIRLSEKNRGTYIVKPSKKILITERIVKRPSEIEQIVMIGSQFFRVFDERELRWEVLPEFSNILQYKVQKAVTNFGGRKWFAWFTPDIPIPDGPYKFRGLPGLILKVEDSKNYHIITMTSILKTFGNFTYPESESYNTSPKLNYFQYKTLYSQFRLDPVADFVGKIPDQQDQYGNMRTGMQILNEFRQKEIQRLKKDNNIIEIDLLIK